MGSAGALLSWGAEGWLDDIAFGVLVTAGLAAATLPFGLAIGFFVALAKQSDEPSLRLAGNIYTTIFRGLPELLTLFLVYFGAQILLQNAIRLLQPDATIAVNSFVSGIVALGVVFSSYASEVFLSAFRAIPRGQYEGGHSIGLSGAQTMRLVILPQLIRIALPGLANQWMVLLKDTALVSAIGLGDILGRAMSRPG
jgi:polar amino acid transport system permease protein